MDSTDKENFTKPNTVALVSAFREDALGKDDAVGIAEKIRCGDLDALSVTLAAIERAKSVNPELNAIAVENFDAAVPASKKGFEGVFQGVPTFIKDTDEVKGLPLYMGSQCLPGELSTKSSITAKKVLATGLNCLGTTTTPEFGFTGTTESMRFGATRNPWNPTYSTGGSSGGSSALVAAGVVPIAHANDGAGSIRIPASCCGLVGMKPSRGRIKDKETPPHFPANIFHEGVVTRTVRDTWAFFSSIERQTPAAGLPAIGDISEPRSANLRVGVLTEDCNGKPCAEDLIQACIGVADQLEALGHGVEVISNPFYSRFDADFWLLWAHCAFAIRYGAGKMVSPKFDPSRMEPWAKYLVNHHWKNLHKLPAAFWRLRRFISDYETVFDNYDILLTPTLGTTTPKLGVFGPQIDGETHWQRIHEFLPFTKYQNISGAPAISLPCATDDDGLPIGIQLATRLGGDRLLLELSLQLEGSSAWNSIYNLHNTQNI
jgi:amidase